MFPCSAHHHCVGVREEEDGESGSKCGFMFWEILFYSDSAVCKDERKYSIYIRGRQINKWQAEGVHLQASLEFCARASHSIREMQSDNLSRNWS